MTSGVYNKSRIRIQPNQEQSYSPSTIPKPTFGQVAQTPHSYFNADVYPEIQSLMNDNNKDKISKEETSDVFNEHFYK